MTQIIHFGIYPKRTMSRLKFFGATRNPQVEQEFDLTDVGWLSPAGAGHPFWLASGPIPTGVRMYVSGSWACWGTADQGTDGDASLHIAVHVDDPAVLTAAFYDEMHEFIARRTFAGHVLDYAIVTPTTDNSETDAVATFRGNPPVVVYGGEGVSAVDSGGSPMRCRVCRQMNLDEEGCPSIKTECCMCAHGPSYEH